MMTVSQDVPNCRQEEETLRTRGHIIKMYSSFQGALFNIRGWILFQAESEV